MPPRLWQQNNQTVLAPIDAEAGGTWIGANTTGQLFCLLNYYPDASLGHASCDELSNDSPPSRGHLIPRLLGRSALSLTLKDLEKKNYRPFNLLSFRFRQNPVCDPVGMQRWSGQKFETLAIPEVLSSSSYLSRQIEQVRMQYFAQTKQSKINAESLLRWHLRYHTSHQPRINSQPKFDDQPKFGIQPEAAKSPNSAASGNAASVCMHRDIAGQVGATQSLTHVRVRGSTLQMDYFDGPPCTAFGKNFVPRSTPRWFRQVLQLQR